MSVVISLTRATQKKPRSVLQQTPAEAKFVYTTELERYETVILPDQLEIPFHRAIGDTSKPRKEYAHRVQVAG